MNDGLPHTPLSGLDPNLSRGKGLAGVAGDEFLNVVFGWAPLLSDVRKTILSLKTANKQIKALQEGSGKQQRRTFAFPREEQRIFETLTTDNDSGSSFQNVSDSLTEEKLAWPLGARREYDKSTILRRDVYFRGAFTYYMPPDKGLMNRLERYEQEANKLLGTRLNAETVWNLTPWSWLVDWFGDIGSVMGSASRLSEDGLVLRYGYLMSHTRDEVHYTSNKVRFKAGEIGSVTTILRRESKERVKATPFGFGLDIASFSLKQWAILSALGLTKGDRRLR